MGHQNNAVGVLMRMFTKSREGSDLTTTGKDAFGYRCDVRNFSDTPLFDVRLAFDVIFREVAKDASNPSSQRSGDIKERRRWVVELPNALDATTGRFTFYILSGTDDRFTIMAPLDRIGVRIGGQSQLP